MSVTCHETFISDLQSSKNAYFCGKISGIAQVTSANKNIRPGYLESNCPVGMEINLEFNQELDDYNGIGYCNIMNGEGSFCEFVLAEGDVQVGDEDVTFHCRDGHMYVVPYKVEE